MLYSRIRLSFCFRFVFVFSIGRFDGLFFYLFLRSFLCALCIDQLVFLSSLCFCFVLVVRVLALSNADGVLVDFSFVHFHSYVHHTIYQPLYLGVFRSFHFHRITFPPSLPVAVVKYNMLTHPIRMNSTLGPGPGVDVGASHEISPPMPPSLS